MVSRIAHEASSKGPARHEQDVRIGTARNDDDTIFKGHTRNGRRRKYVPARADQHAEVPVALRAYAGKNSTGASASYEEPDVAPRRRTA